MKNYEPTLRQSMAIREFIGAAITPLIEDVLVKKLGQAMAFLKEQEQTEREWVGLTEAEIIELAGGGITRDERMIARAIEAKVKEKNYG
jgi:hypothetical protein